MADAHTRTGLGRWSISIDTLREPLQAQWASYPRYLNGWGPHSALEKYRNGWVRGYQIENEPELRNPRLTGRNLLTFVENFVELYPIVGAGRRYSYRPRRLADYSGDVSTRLTEAVFEEIKCSREYPINLAIMRPQFQKLDREVHSVRSHAVAADRRRIVHRLGR